MMQIAEDIVKKIQDEIAFEGLVYTGELFDSWEITREGDGSITIGSPLVWAAVTDGGRVPGKMPPVSALFPWVKAKLGITDDKEAMSIAWAIARKLEREGMEPRHYVRKALLQMEVGSE